MKTDAIKTLTSAHTDACVSRGIDYPLAREAEAELTATTERITAMEMENAAMRGALLDVELTCDGISEGASRNELLNTIQYAKTFAQDILEAALSPPTGKVLVDREKLQEVYVAFKSWLGSAPGIYPTVLTWLADVASIADEDRIAGGAASLKED